MASADVHTKYYFCHSCSQQVLATQDITCSRCESGAIEELPRHPVEHDDSAENFASQWHGLNRERRPRNFGARGGHVFRAPQSQIMFSFNNGINGAAPNINRIIHQLFGDLAVAPGIQFGEVGGAHGDYVWGPHGLDNIITQLMNQLDNTGPPPADKTKINSLPIHEIAKQDLDENTDCAICREQFEMNEKVKKLPCDHKFHEPCIVPWLELHDSCPICRCNLNGERSRDGHG